MCPPSHFGPPTAPSSTARAERQAASVCGGSAAPPNGRRTASTSSGRCSRTRTACSRTSGPMPSPGRQAITSGTRDLILDKREHEHEQLVEPLVRDRTAVHALDVRDEPRLALRVEERKTALLLVLRKRPHGLDARVDRADEAHVERRDLVAER